MAVQSGTDREILHRELCRPRRRLSCRHLDRPAIEDASPLGWLCHYAFEATIVAAILFLSNNLTPWLIMVDVHGNAIDTMYGHRHCRKCGASLAWDVESGNRVCAGCRQTDRHFANSP